MYTVIKRMEISASHRLKLAEFNLQMQQNSD